MAGLKWVRLDTQFPTNSKVLELAEAGKFRALFVWCSSLAYCGAQGTDGFIKKVALPYIHGRPTDAKDLVAARLWKPDRMGWYLPDWAEYQQLSSKTEEVKAAQQVGSMKGNCIRWHGADCGCWMLPPAG